MMNPSLLLSIPSSSNLIVSVFFSPFLFLPSPSRLSIVLTFLPSFVRTVHKDDISREQLKELLYEEIMSFRPPPMEP